MFDFETFNSRFLLELLDEVLDNHFEECFDEFCGEWLEEC